MKYYAVRKGRQIGIFKTWEEAKKQVFGYSGAEYASFVLEEDAEKYMGSLLKKAPKQVTIPQFLKEEILKEDGRDDLSSHFKKGADPKKLNQKIQDALACIDNETAYAFVDGSFSDGQSGSGIYYKDNETEMKISFSSEDWDFNRNVSGEIEAAKMAAIVASQRDRKKLILFYDYDGVRKWPTREWKANKESTREYASFMQDKEKSGLVIEFIHVEAHTGITYNELADRLAKEAVGLS